MNNLMYLNHPTVVPENRDTTDSSDDARTDGGDRVDPDKSPYLRA